MGINKQVRAQKARIGPIECYVEGKEFLGSEYGLFLGICLVGLILGGLVPIVLYGPAFCGMALCFLTRARGEQVTFEMLFKGFDYFVPSLIATLIYMGMAFVMAIPLMILIFVLMAMMATQEPALAMIAVVLMVCAYVGWILIIGVASMLFMFAVLLIVDKNQDGPEAMRNAFQGLMTNFWGVLISATVGQLMVFIGMAMCIIPGFLLLPIVFAGHFVVYRKIFGVENVYPVAAQRV